MRDIISVFLLFVLTLIGLSNNSIAQQGLMKNNKRNSIEVYFPIKNFLDGATTNWFILKPYQLSLYKRYTPHKIGTRYVYAIPFTFGIQYNKAIINGNLIQISATIYLTDYFKPERKPGEVIVRGYGLFSIGYLHHVMSNDRTKIHAIGELNYRYGYEIIHLYYYQNWEERIAPLNLNDIGLSAGFRVEHSIPLNFFVSAETKYTRFIYRGSKGIDFNGGHKKATPNTFTIKLGIGYRF